MIWWMNLVPGVNIILSITNETNTSNTEMMWGIEIIYVMHQPEHLCSHKQQQINEQIDTDS